MTNETLPALTLIPPWAHAVAYWGKDVENRTWNPPKSLVGQRVAIHSGRSPFRQLKDGSWTISDGAAHELEDALGFCRQAGRFVNVPLARSWLHDRCSAVLCVATVSGVHDSRFTMTRPASRWFVGPVGWLLTDVVALGDPVPCRGAQGIWRLPADVDAAVRAQLQGGT